MYVDYMGWTLDFTGIQMLLTMKHIMYAFDIYDGTLPESV
jgi:lysophospholipid acyltransferase